MFKKHLKQKLGIFIVFVILIISSFFIAKNSMLSMLSLIATGDNPVRFVNPKKDFPRFEKPQFEIAIPYKSNSNIGKSKIDVWNNANEQINVTVKRLLTNSTVPAKIYKQASGKFMVVLDSHERGSFGKYSISVTAKESFIYTRDLTQDFSWGVLAINTNKSIYLPGEKAQLGFGVLDPRGNTLCNAKLTLVIADPNNQKSVLSTDNQSIKRNPKCIGNTYSLKEDYSAVYKTHKAGRYYLNLTALTSHGSYTISDYFEVRNSVPFDIERTQFPSRIYPIKPYPVKLTIKANQDYKGVVYDMVPIDFQISHISNGGTMSRTKNEKMSNAELAAALLDEAKHLGEKDYHIKYNKGDLPNKVDKSPVKVMWNVDFKAGHTYTLSYSIYFPQVSPEYYLLGPFTIGNFAEIRDWQVASDATNCWTGSGADTNWNTTGNWSAGTPTTTSNATFHGTTCTAGTPDKNVTVNVDPTLTGTGGGITISSNYAGTMTQASIMTIDGDNAVGFNMAGGTFTGATQNITTSIFVMSGGTFTSTTGILFVDGNSASFWKITAGTFTANGGTVQFIGPNATETLTGSTTFNNLIFDDTACNGCGVDYVIASGTTLTVNGTLTLQDLSSGGGGCSIDGTGGVSAKGNITLAGSGNSYGQDGCNGAGVITVNGTGTQTITGTTDNNHFLPGLNINKSSGTLNFVNTIGVDGGGWTYTAGTLSMGTSTIVFKCSGSSCNVTITGSMTFYQLTFDELAPNGFTNAYTVASGTTLTVSNTLTFTNAGNTSGNCTVNGPGTISAQGNITIGGSLGSSWYGCNGTAVVNINGTGTQTFTGGSTGAAMVPAININKTSGTLNLSNTIAVDQGWTYTAGTVNAGTSTVYMNNTATSAVTISGSMTFNNLTFDEQICNGCGTTYTISSGVLTVSGTLTLTNANSSGAGSPPNINGPGTISAQGNITTAGLGGGGSAQITMSGTANQTITANGTNFPTGNFTINKPSGTVTLATNLSLSGSGQTLTITSGTLDLAGFNLTVNSTFTVGASGTLKLQGGETVTTGSNVLSAGSTVQYTGSGTYTSLALGNSYSNITISGTGSFTPASNITATGNFTQTAGTFNVAPSGMTVSQNFAHTGGTFSAGSSTVTFDNAGYTSVLSGSTTFYNLTSIIPNKTIQFTNGTTTTVTNTLTLRGSSVGLLTLASTTPGSQWNLTVNGTATLSKLSVQDSNACGGTTKPLTTTGSLNQGDNTCWSITGSYTGWYSNLWTKRQAITINHTQVVGDQTNFPVLISLASDSSLSSFALSNGYDILFTSDDGTTKLSHEIEAYNSTTGQLNAWVNIPLLSSTVDTTIYMYYGNSSASNQQNPSGVWNSNYVMVNHLGETGLSSGSTIKDSTGNAINGTTHGGITSLTSGKIDGAIADDGVTGSYYLTGNSSAFPTGDYTVSFWINSSSIATSQYVFEEANNLFVLINGSKAGMRVGADPYTYGATTLSSNTWYYIVATRTGSAEKLYVNASNDASTTSSTTITNTAGCGIMIGADITNNTNCTTTDGLTVVGNIDEVRYLNVGLTANWITTEYNNQSSPSTFLTLQPVSNLPITRILGGVKIHGGTKIHTN